MAVALLTGGAGAIGSNLARALLERGDDVVILDDLSSGHEPFVPEGARLLRGTVTDDDDVAAAFAVRPDVVFHLAALFANQNSVEHPDEDLITNGLGTIKVFEEATRAGVRRLVNISSSCVYGAREVMRESDPIEHLDTPYAITKLLGEHYATFWAEQRGLPVVSVRLFNVYGPYELPGRYRNVIPNFIGTALAGKPLTITGTGDETRDFTFVSDTVEGLLRVADRDVEAGSLFNIGSGVETPIRRVADLVNELTGNAAGIELQPRRSWDQVTRRVGDVTLARERLGFSASVVIDEGIARTVEWLRVALRAT